MVKSLSGAHPAAGDGVEPISEEGVGACEGADTGAGIDALADTSAEIARGGGDILCMSATASCLNAYGWSWCAAGSRWSPLQC